MLVVNYNGNKPITDYFKYGVEGNNNADLVRFVILKQQGHLDLLENSTVFVKCQNDDFSDKIEIDGENIKVVGNCVYVDWFLMKKHTTQGTLQVSLCFENENDVVWQTQAFTLKIMNGVVADDEIVNDYPTILQQLQKQISELSAGAGEVEIKEIFIENNNGDYQCYDKMMKLDKNDKPVYNDGNDIYLCIKTTPISESVYQEIVNGRLAIRFDYPVKNRKKGFTHHLVANDRKLKAVAFITEDNVRTNRYGEKYIYWRESFVNFFNRFFELESANMGLVGDLKGFNQDDEMLNSILYECENERNVRFAGVIRNNDPEYGTPVFARAVGKLNRSDSGGFSGYYEDNSTHTTIVQASWKDKQHNAWCPLMAEAQELDYMSGNFEIRSKFTNKNMSNKYKTRYFELRNGVGTSEGYFYYYGNSFNGDMRVCNFLNKVALRPCIAILDENYASLSIDTNCWLKHYKQSEQYITLKANALFGLVFQGENRDCIFTIAQMRVSPKR